MNEETVSERSCSSVHEHNIQIFLTPVIRSPFIVSLLSVIFFFQ